MSQKAVTSLMSNLSPRNTALKEPNGWWQCGDTGIIRQWGFFGGNGSITFPRKFPNAVTNIQLTHGPNGYAAVSYVITKADNIGFTALTDKGFPVTTYFMAEGY
ncbi:gp53-like domain-containing protein [Xenorhabdus bovienii]